jgi:nicotinamidase-related amidase
MVMKRTFDSFYRTKLEKILKHAGIERILICGLLTGMCVLSTTFSAFSRGYEVCLLEDATSDSDQRRNDVISWVYPEVSHVTRVNATLPDGGQQQPRLQQLNYHAPEFMALPQLDPPMPVGGALIVLNATPMYMSTQEIEKVSALARAFRIAGGIVYNVHTETSPSGGTAKAFERLFGRPLEIQFPAAKGPNIPINIESRGVFDGQAGKSLRSKLRAQGVGQIALAGALSGIHVLHTMLDAFNRQFWVLIVDDCLFDPQQQRRKVVVDAYEGQLCTSVSCDQLLRTMT